MHLKGYEEFYLKKKELVEKIFTEISPLLNGMTYGQASSVVDGVREKVATSVYFIPPQIPEATSQS